MSDQVATLFLASAASAYIAVLARWSYAASGPANAPPRFGSKGIEI